MGMFGVGNGLTVGKFMKPNKCQASHKDDCLKGSGSDFR